MKESALPKTFVYMYACTREMISLIISIGDWNSQFGLAISKRSTLASTAYQLLGHTTYESCERLPIFVHVKMNTKMKPERTVYKN